MLRRFSVVAAFSSLALFAQQEAPKSIPVQTEVKVTTGTAPATAASTTAAPEAPSSNSEPKITFSQCHVDGPYIAITFDDGPHKVNTPRLLEMLKQRGIKATFFCVGECVAEYPDIAKRIVSEGHEIASHSWNHPLLSKMSEASVREQLEKTHQAIKQAAGIEPKLFRPPYGGFTQRQRNWAHAVYGYRTILWDVDPLDWQVRNAAHVESEILKGTTHGSIILAHDIHKSTVDAMPATLDALSAKGYKFVTVSELLAMDKPPAPKAKATPSPKVTGNKAAAAKS